MHYCLFVKVLFFHRLPVFFTLLPFGSFWCFPRSALLLYRRHFCLSSTFFSFLRLLFQLPVSRSPRSFISTLPFPLPAPVPAVHRSRLTFYSLFVISVAFVPRNECYLITGRCHRQALFSFFLYFFFSAYHQ